MPVIFISQHSASDSNKPERNTCRFNQVTKHVKYLSWNKGVWHMKCEPPRSPLGDVIFSDLYLFTASADTFKRKKKKLTQNRSQNSKQITLNGTSGSQRYKHRHACAHTHVQMYKCTYTYMHIHSQLWSVQVYILNKRYLKNSLC